MWGHSRISTQNGVHNKANYVTAIVDPVGSPSVALWRAVKVVCCYDKVAIMLFGVLRVVKAHIIVFLDPSKQTLNTVAYRYISPTTLVEKRIGYFTNQTFSAAVDQRSRNE